MLLTAKWNLLIYLCLFDRLHNFLLQPRGVQPMETSSAKTAEQTGALKVKKAIGKIRVEGMV